MNFRHAIGFLCVGMLLMRLPQLAPHSFATTGIDGSSTRLLWLAVMSWVQLAIGGLFLLGRVGSLLAGLLAYTPPLPAELVSAAPAPRLVPGRTVRSAPAIKPALPRPVLPLPTAFEAGLLEQQRAA